MRVLVDTNVLVYGFDPRSPAKRKTAVKLLRQGAGSQRFVLPHQAIVEFVAVTSRPREDLGGRALLGRELALEEAQSLAAQFPVIYPDQAVLQTAILGATMYRLSWFDAHLWAYAEVNGIDEILSEDFEHGRHYGSVRVRNPFLEAADSVHELPALYES